MAENNLQDLDLLKNQNTLVVDAANDQLQPLSKSKIRQKKKYIKIMITASIFLISVVIFSSGLIIFGEATNVFNSSSDATVFLPSVNNNNTQNDLIVGLPGQGLILGSRTLTTWTNKTILQFLGIPYAKSPSGTRRFKPPVQRTPWTGILDVSQNGLACPEITRFNSTTSHSNSIDLEDCLNLNVFTKNRKLKLPVMVYIHGGSFTNGSAAEFPPNYLLEKDVVLVVLQYRLGVLGFISTQSDSIPGNAGVHDVIFALKWIQKYIHFFGGDSNKVTIFGQSAGAAIVSLLTITPVIQYQKLFHKAIAQSGSIFSKWALNTKPIDLAKITCETICKSQLNNNCSQIENINNCLVNANIKDLLQITSSDLAITLGDLGGILPKLPMSLGNDMKTKYPLMTGATKHDGSYVLTIVYDKLLYYAPKGSITPRDLFRFIIEFANSDSTGLIENLLYREMFTKKNQTKNTFIDLIPEFIDLCSTLYFKSPALTLAKMNSPYDNKKTFLYAFDYEGTNTRFGYGESTEHYPFYGGVHHSDDYIYLFPYFHNLNEKDINIVQQMVNLWTSFAINGVPKINETLSLSPINGAGPYLRINTDITIGNDYTDEFFAATNDPEKYKLIKSKN